jgi:heme oxygenase
MAIKDYIVEQHKEAENTLFFKSIIDRKMSNQIWHNFLFNKMLILSCLEEKIEPIEGLSRVAKLRDDLLSSRLQNFQIKKITFDYIDYLRNANNDFLFAHVYVWYMGDLNGGKMIKKIREAQHTNLEFEDPEKLKKIILDKVDISMIDEISVCFGWVTKLLKEFDKEISQESN